MPPVKKNDVKQVAVKKPQAGARISLAEQAYTAVKQLILTLQLKPGDYINEAQLCERLSLSRSPVHIAIHRLDREGLVEIIPRKGIIVKPETVGGFFDLVNARLLIEPYLTGLAAERATPQLVSELEQLVAKGWKCHKAKDRQGCMEVDRIFHQRIYESSGSKILLDVASLLLDRSMRFWYLPVFGPNEEELTITALEELSKAIKNRDRNEAYRQMAVHIGALREKFIGLGQG